MDARLRHQVVAWQPGPGVASAPAAFRVARSWRLVLDQADPAGDDHGPEGRTRYPTDASWGPLRQMDLRRVQVWRAGGALRIALGMHRTSRSWNPPNGFDHVAFTLFLGRPEAPGGSPLMPLQDASLPGGMRWQLRLRAHGWSNALFTAEGAGAQHEGTPRSPGALLQVDAARHTVQFTLPASALAGLDTGPGLQLYLNTWDWDGGYRALLAEPGGHSMGGAPGPRWMDDLPPIRLP